MNDFLPEPGEALAICLINLALFLVVTFFGWLFWTGVFWVLAHISWVG